MKEYNAVSIDTKDNKAKSFDLIEFKKVEADKNDNKAIDSDIINPDKIKFNFAENKYILYTFLFYTFGLFVGTYFYKISDNSKLNKLIAIKDNTFGDMFATKFCIYFSIFLLVSFLGFCLISYPIINIFPLSIGMITGIKLGYYYITYQAKGVGFALIMIVPYTALFITTISYVIKNSTELSAKIKAITKGEGESDFNLTPHLKIYLILALIITTVAITDCALTKLLVNIVTI